MKTMTLIVALLSAGLFYSCHDLPHIQKQGLSCYNCFDKETFGHTFADFEDVVDRYTAERWNVINSWMASPSSVVTGGSGTGKTDSRAIWFSLDSLEQFICTIKKYSQRLTEDPGELGIRMYYAVYPGGHPKFPGEHTIFMVPTFRKPGDITATGNDFDPREAYAEQLLNANKEPVLQNSFRNMRSKPNVAALILSGNSNPDPQMRANDGSLCPPCTKGCIHSILDSQ